MRQFTVWGSIRSVALALFLPVIPEAVEAQMAHRIRCVDGCAQLDCEPDELRGYGSVIGIFKNNYGNCYVLLECWYCTEEQVASNTSLKEVLRDLKKAKTQEDLTRVATAYRTRLLLNASENMVLALGGCNEEKLAPISMVFLSTEKIETLKDLDLETVEGLTSAGPGSTETPGFRPFGQTATCGTLFASDTSWAGKKG